MRGGEEGMTHILRITARRPNGAESFKVEARVIDGEWSETDPPLRWFATSTNMTPR